MPNSKAAGPALQDIHQATLTCFTVVILLFSSFAVDGYAQKVEEAKFSVQKLEDGRVLIENFENEEVGTLPSRWYNRDGDFVLTTLSEEKRSLYQYQIKEEGDNKYLHYKGKIVKHLNFPLLNKNVNIYETPILRWRWRAIDLPKGGDESSSNKNDAVLNVYVVFDFKKILFKKVPRSIRYTWSSTLDVGTNTSKLFGNQQILVLESGKENIGQWKTFERNIVNDYKELFGEKPPQKPIALLLLSEGDSTNDISIGDVDDIYLMPED